MLVCQDGEGCGEEGAYWKTKNGGDGGDDCYFEHRPVFDQAIVPVYSRAGVEFDQSMSKDTLSTVLRHVTDPYK